MDNTLGSLCKKLLNQSNSFEDVALYVDTNKSQNLELLLGAADFAKFLVVEDAPFCTWAHQQVLQKSMSLIDLSYN